MTTGATHKLNPPMIDLRSQLPRADWTLPARARTTSITVHYNGPTVARSRQTMPGLLTQLQIDARYQMRPGGLGAPAGGDGLQYPYVIDAVGIIYLTRDPDLAFWHAGHRVANTTSIPVHFPVGGLQDVTPAQWASGLALFRMLADRYAFSPRAVKGHCEWSNHTLCPGPRLLQRIRDYRADVLAPGAGLYRVRRSVPAALIREGPGTTYPVALGGAAREWPGNVVDVDVVRTDGEAVGNDRRWAHLRDGRGFISLTLLEAL